MHKETIPSKVDPFRFAENAIRLQGTLPIKNMDRLCESLSSNEGEVVVSIEFGIDEEGIYYARGHLATSLQLQCQRCLEPFRFDISSDFASGIVHTEDEADQLPQRYDPVISKDNSLIISDMLEEELIVSLPIVPMHDLNECKVKLPFAKKDESADELGTESPFKVIELLRSKSKVKK